MTKDWKQETLRKLIEIEIENGEQETTITMNYINYLKKLIRMIDYGKAIGGTQDD